MSYHFFMCIDNCKFAILSTKYIFVINKITNSSLAGFQWGKTHRNLTSISINKLRKWAVWLSRYCFIFIGQRQTLTWTKHEKQQQIKKLVGFSSNLGCETANFQFVNQLKGRTEWTTARCTIIIARIALEEFHSNEKMFLFLSLFVFHRTWIRKTARTFIR